MNRSLEPLASDPSRPPIREPQTNAALGPAAAERVANWVDRALRPGGLAPRRALLGALLSMAAIFAVDLLTGDRFGNRKFKRPHPGLAQASGRIQGG